MSYTVSLYDKDQDYYLDIAHTDDKEQAIAICKAVYNLMKNAYVLNKEHRTDAVLIDTASFPYEQFDWVQVFEYDTHCIFVNNKEFTE